MGRTVLGPAPGPARQPVGGELKDFTYTPSVNRTLSQAERVNHFPLYAISLGHALTHWYPATFYLLLPFIAADVGLSYTQVGVLITMRAVSQTLVTLPGGAIVDMVGRRGLVMALALAWSGVPYFFLGLSTNYVVILACMGLMGLGGNLWHPAAISDLSERYPGRRGYAIAIHALGANLGDLLAPLAAGFLLVYLAYSHVLVANFVPGLALAALFFIWMRGEAAKQKGKTEALGLATYWHGLKEMARNAGVLLLSLVGGIRAMASQGLSTFLPFYLQGLGFGPALMGLYLAVVQGAGLIASPLSGLLSDRVGRKPVVTAGMVATSVIVIVIANLTLVSVDLNWIFVGVLSLLGFFLYSMRPALQAWTMDLVPKHMGGTAVGLTFASQSLFSAVSPAVGGLLADQFGLLAAFYFIAATILVANLIVLVVPDRVLAEREPAAAAAGG